MKLNIKECTIGIIGLGQMGSGIAANLVHAGYSIIGYDVKLDAVQRLVEAWSILLCRRVSSSEKAPDFTRFLHFNGKWE